jgi:hypothetical protein
LNDEITTLKSKNEDLEKDNRRYKDNIEKNNDKDTIWKFIVIID